VGFRFEIKHPKWMNGQPAALADGQDNVLRTVKSGWFWSSKFGSDLYSLDFL
jgi:hypothetical protein